MHQAQSTNVFSYIFANPDASDNGKAHVGLQVPARPSYLTGFTKDLRHLRINLFLPDPYNRGLWMDTLAQQLTSLILSVGEVTN